MRANQAQRAFRDAIETPPISTTVEVASLDRAASLCKFVTDSGHLLLEVSPR